MEIRHFAAVVSRGRSPVVLPRAAQTMNSWQNEANKSVVLNLLCNSAKDAAQAAHNLSIGKA